MLRIGQLIVAIHDHPQGHFKKGDIFNVKRKTDPVCNCMEYLVDIGINSKHDSQVCGNCGTLTPKYFRTLWFSNRNFVPADYTFARSVIRKALKDMEEYKRSHPYKKKRKRRDEE